ncbi:MAG: AlpA family phage regulatory protein [Pseudomonas sp.]|uniref:helix-turn-helix transcriptional regulator n=1 Tax=Pseudomonas sp. TaxID=306 RepID=UPI003BB7FEB5
MSQKPLDRLIKLEDVISQAGIGKTKIYNLIQLGEFPAPIKLGYASRWSQIEIQDWVEQLKAKRFSGGDQ